MTRDLPQLSNQTFDLLVIGGGILGAGIAWDAATRGLSCALVEQGDFAGGTSSKTTKLIHGGIRYLENLEFKLVRQSIRERWWLLRFAPNLVKPLPFLVPVVGNSPRPWPLVKIGVFLYDLLAGKRSIHPHRFLNRPEVEQIEPLLREMKVRKGALYYDAQMDDARLVLEVLKAGSQAGARVANYCPVTRFLSQGGRLVAAEVEDRLTGKRFEVRARLLINATGPWVDRLRRLADPAAKPIVRPSKGIHLLYPDLGLKQALLLSSPSDQRIFFLIPWRGMTLIGTTDTDYSGDPGAARAEPSDVEYLIRETNRLLPKLRLDPKKIISTFAGVRPLVAQEKKDPWAVSRGHLIHEDSNGLLSIVGGKFTTFRMIAQDLVDRVSPRLPGKGIGPCRTGQLPLGRAEEKERMIRGWIEQDPSLAQPLCPHHAFRKADLRYAVEEEMALHLSGLLFRRLGVAWSPCQGLDSLDSAADYLGHLLGWDPAERQRQIAAYRQEISLG